MDHPALYPLRFVPTYQYRLWGGRRLGSLLSTPLPAHDPVGEAWLLSDRDDHPSAVMDGPLQGQTIAQLIARSPEGILGKLAHHFTRFPLLLKFLDVTKVLSVQVHPSDVCTELIPPGESGKTEAWVVLAHGPEARIYAGLKDGTTMDALRRALGEGTVAERLAGFKPELGEAVLIQAGTVHALSDVVVFEVQENSDVTFRLFDWDHIDPRTHEKRPLQVEQALACIDFARGPVLPTKPQVAGWAPVLRETLLRCDHFGMCRMSGMVPFKAGAADTCRVLVCIAGHGDLKHGDRNYPFQQGDAILLPAAVGACTCLPNGPVVLLEISLPEIS
jgi:mannose-6-phosphate isomerase